MMVRFGSAQPPEHPEDVNGVITRNVEKPSHFDAAQETFIEFCCRENFKIYF
jgi:hypothetical protein